MCFLNVKASGIEREKGKKGINIKQDLLIKNNNKGQGVYSEQDNITWRSSLK